MPLVEVVDKSGFRMKLEYLDRVFFPLLPFGDDLQGQINNTRDLELRPDDVLICAYPKCGTHWVWEMVQMLKAGRVAYDARTKEALMLEFMSKDTLDNLPSPRTLNTHFFFRHLPKQAVRDKTKIIFLNRDPRDVVVSQFNHYKGLVEIATYEGEFRDFFLLFLQGTMAFGSWFEYTKEWEQVIDQNPELPVRTFYYEEMKKNPVDTVKELAAFLEVPASEELCRDIAQACDFDHLRAANIREKTDPLQFTWREDHPGVYRKGKSGDWKNWFTVTQQEQFDAFYASQMAGTKIFDRYRTGTT